jgi:hypothetical protein
MATDETGGKKSETSDYSATKAPENREHVESDAPLQRTTLKPGGAHGANAPVGMSEIDLRTIPSRAVDPALEDFGDTRDNEEGWREKGHGSRDDD